MKMETTCIECNKKIEKGIELTDGSFLHKKCGMVYFYWRCKEEDCEILWPYVEKEVGDGVCGECGGELRKATKKEIRQFLKDVDIEE
jgi:hypothetical protein